MERHCLNAEKVAQALENNEKIGWVTYPSLPSNKYYPLAQKYLPKGSCGVVSFGVKGGRAAAEKFMKALKIIAIETHVADARSCCLHPASATHRQMNDEELIAAGVPGDLVRLSCGLENYQDLIADIEQALATL
jgi:O-acetylhomoserine (thiol)-lyase